MEQVAVDRSQDWPAVGSDGADDEKAHALHRPTQLFGTEPAVVCDDLSHVRPGSGRAVVEKLLQSEHLFRCLVHTMIQPEASTPGALLSGGWPGDEGSPNLPMVAEGVLDSPEEPAVLFGDGPDPPCARLDGASHHRLGTVDYEQHPRGGSAGGLRAEVGMCRRLVRDRERGAFDRELVSTAR